MKSFFFVGCSFFNDEKKNGLSTEWANKQHHLASSVFLLKKNIENIINLCIHLFIGMKKMTQHHQVYPIFPIGKLPSRTLSFIRLKKDLFLSNDSLPFSAIENDRFEWKKCPIAGITKSNKWMDPESSSIDQKYRFNIAVNTLCGYAHFIFIGRFRPKIRKFYQKWKMTGIICRFILRLLVRACVRVCVCFFASPIFDISISFNDVIYYEN